MSIDGRPGPALMTTPRAPGGRPLTPWPAAAGAGVLVLALVLRFGGALGGEAVPGLTRAGAMTKSGLALAEFAATMCGAVTVGWLLLAAVFLPGRAPAALVRRHLRAAALWATAWALAMLMVIMFSAADLFGVPVTTGVTGNMLRTFLLELPQGRALLMVAAAAVLVAVASRPVSTPGGAGYVLVLALAGMLPPVFTGHATGTSHHTAAVYSLAAHIVGAALWVGGLVVLLAAARDARALDGWLPAVVTRYSRLAAVCLALVAASGLVNAWIRLDGLDLGSRYGALVAAKTAALAAIGGLGWWHRRASIPALREHPGRPGRRAFVRIATVEVVVMAATMALATGLSRTPPPEVSQGTLDLVTLRLGFPLPGPFSWTSALTGWSADPLFVSLIVACAALYATGVARLRRGGSRWPMGRVIAWYAGLAALLVVTCGGLARYSMVLFSAHVVQHLVVSLLVPALLLLGAPVTLTLRALPRDSAGGGRTVRELLVAALRSRALRVACHPLVAPAVFVAGLYGFYLTPLFEASLRNHALHAFSMAVFMASAGCYLWPIIGRDPLPGRPPLGARFLLAACVVPFHALFGAVIMGWGGVLAGDWFTGLGRTWGATALRDQRAGGGLAWALGEAAALVIIMALAHRWIRDDPPAARRADADAAPAREPRARAGTAGVG
ncbi:cytochrome c oxidase assembly protein [Actinomadura sp. 9N407]|uniref:cytochrome c oxidase assembly protein n=1 Tax=Actinomadura sp. 9N407 TaxID=3375154 RepID=UPI00378F4352